MRRLPAVLPLLLAAACGPPAGGGGPGTLPAFMAAEIEFGPDGTCYGRDIAPAVIETVRIQEVERPAVLAPDGAVLEPAVYRSVIRQSIVRERGEQRFETLCPPAYSEEFVASLQRALAVRGFYRGPITGLVDAATGAAIRAFQRPEGPDSPLLSVEAGRRLGLVPLSEAQIDAL